MDVQKEKPSHFVIEISFNGAEKNENVTPEETIKSVLDRAIKLFHITQNPHLMSLFKEDGTELSDAITVAQAGISKKEGNEKKPLLYLRQSKVKGG